MIIKRDGKYVHGVFGQVVRTQSDATDASRVAIRTAPGAWVYLRKDEAIELIINLAVLVADLDEE